MRRRILLVAFPLALVLAAPNALAGPKSVQGLIIHASPRPVPALDIRDNEGKPAGFDTLAGKPALVNLWASWCMPCVAELPALDRLAPKARARGVEVMALSLDRGGKVTATNTFARLGIVHLGIRTDEARAAAEKLDAPYLPVTLILDAQGRETARFIGPAEWDGPGTARLMDALAQGRALTPDMAPPPPAKAATAP